MEDKEKILTYKIQESTHEVNCCEKIEINNPAPTIGDADKVSKSSTFVNSSEETINRRNALSSTLTTVNNTEQDQTDQNNLDEGSTCVGSKGINKVASDIDQSSLEKVVPLIAPRKIKARITLFIKSMNEVVVNPISAVPRNERVLGTNWVLTGAADGRFKVRPVTPGRMQRHVVDRAIVAAKDKFGRSRNGALDQGELSTQYYSMQLRKVFRYNSS